MFARRVRVGIALFTLALAPVTVTACGKDAPELSPQQQINRDFVDLTWTLLEPLKSSEKCVEIGAALAKWEATNGARFRELAGKITTLHGADASNFGKVENRFKNIAFNCVHPKGADKFPLDIRRHDDNVARVFAMFPKMETSYELR